MWVLVRPGGRIVEWAGAHRTRAKVMGFAAMGCISSSEYHECANDGDRWNIAYRRGYRIRRANVELSL